MGKGKRKEKEERKEMEEKKWERRKAVRGREKKKKRKGLRFSVFRRLEVVSSRIKVGLLDESYE